MSEEIKSQEEETIYQQDLDVYEQEHIKEQEDKKINWTGDNTMPLKQRIYNFLATVLVVLVKNLTTKIKWQVGFVLYLAIVCPVGTYTSIKWLIEKIFS